MCKLNNRYWLEIDVFCDSNGKNTENFFEGILPTVFLWTSSLLGATPPTSSRLEKFSQRLVFVKKQTQMHKNQNPDMIATYRECFFGNMGNADAFVDGQKPLFTQNSLSTSLVFDSV